MEEFLRRVLPDGGRYVVVAIGNAQGSARELRGIPDIAGVIKASQRLSAAGLNVYVAMGTYGADRNAASAVAKRCLFLDLDAKSFGTKTEAVKALALFCRTTGFPAPSIYVDSGRGIHAYWCFDRDLEATAWRAIADKLKQRCVDVGFKADPTVTADTARIMRVPGTLNTRVDPPVPCVVLKDTGSVYDPAVLLRALIPTNQFATSGALAKLGAMVGANDLGGPMAQTVSSYPQVPYYTTAMANQCGVVTEALATRGKDHTEPQWRHLLSLLTFTEDGDHFVHEISKGHPGYNENLTNAKYAQVKALKEAGKLKPILCSTFATYKNAICSACPHFGKIKTPMVLGKLEESFLPRGYRLGEYSVEKLVKPATDDTPEKWAVAFPYRLTDVEVYDKGGGLKHIRMKCASKTVVRKLDIEALQLHQQGDPLPAAMVAAGLWVTGSNLAEFKQFMTAWLRRMEDTKAAVALEADGLGWAKVGGKDAFAAGGRIFISDGRDIEFFSQDLGQLKPYLPKGDAAPWQLAAAALAADSRQAAVTTLLTSFAAPLMSFTGQKGVTFSLYSTGTGPGKSAVLRTAQAVWGDPVAGMAMVDDTQNAVINRMGFLKTTPVYWDELRSGDGLQASVRMIFTVGQGREKKRLNASIKQQEPGSWDTLVTIASNERIVDHVDQFIKNTDAGRARIFETTLPDLVNPNPAVKKALAALGNNYGHAGMVYAKYLAAHRAEAEKLVQETQDKLAAGVNAANGDRYWIAFMAAIVAAGVLVKRAGLLEIDPKPLLAFLIREYRMQQGGVQQNYKTPTDAATAALWGFVDAHPDQMLIVDTMQPGKGLESIILNAGSSMPRGEILILKAKADRILRIKEASWRTWVTKVLSHSPTTLSTELEKLGMKRTRASLTAGLQAASNARVWCIEVDLNLPPFAGLLDRDT